MGPASNFLSISNYSPSPVYILPHTATWIGIGVLYFVGWYISVLSIHVSYVPLFVRLYTFHFVSSWINRA